MEEVEIKPEKGMEEAWVQESSQKRPKSEDEVASPSDGSAQKRLKSEEEVAVPSSPSSLQEEALKSAVPPSPAPIHVEQAPFLSVVPDTGALAKAKRAVSADKWAFLWWNQILAWAAKDSGSVPVGQMRSFYVSLLEIFPTSGLVWNMLIQMELKRGKKDKVEEYFTSSLLLCQHVPLWLTYLDFIVSKPQTVILTSRKECIDAFEFSIKHIGVDPESAPIWEAYVKYLTGMQCANPVEESMRMSNIREVYQRAIVMPLEGVERIWKAYQAFEESWDPKLVEELRKKLSPPYIKARTTVLQRSGYTKGLRRNQLAVPPTELGDMMHQATLWKRLILYEKLHEDQNLQRLRFTFNSCLVVLRYYPEFWVDYAETMQAELMKQGAEYQETVKMIWAMAADALPGSILLHLKYSLFLENSGRVGEAGAIFETIMQKGTFSAQDKQLGLVQQFLFERRTKGLKEGRVFFAKALKDSTFSSWELVVVGARVELFVNRSAEFARRVLEFGMRSYGKFVPYLLQYISLLYVMNEEANMRVMFDNFMKDEELCRNRELWDEYLKFEIAYGNLQFIDKVARRRADALGNAVDPNGIFATLNRFKVLDLFPAGVREIQSMALGVNVALKDGRRGDAAEKEDRDSLHSSASSLNLPSERGNPLHVVFRDPPQLQKLPRPVLSGEGCGLTPYTREIAIGAALPGETSVPVPSAVLDLISLLPGPHEYDGPSVNVDQLLFLLEQAVLPVDPALSTPVVERNVIVPATTVSAPPAIDLFRMRQQLKRKKT